MEQNRRRFCIGDGELVVQRPGPGVVLYVIKGRMTPEFVPHFRQAAQSVVDLGRQVSVFFDTEGMRGYHPAFRDQMTAWHAELKPMTRRAGVLVRSRVVQMAIAIANMVTGGLLVSYSDRAKFEAAIRDALMQ